MPLANNSLSLVDQILVVEPTPVWWKHEEAYSSEMPLPALFHVNVRRLLEYDGLFCGFTGIIHTKSHLFFQCWCGALIRTMHTADLYEGVGYFNVTVGITEPWLTFKCPPPSPESIAIDHNPRFYGYGSVHRFTESKK